nr:RNA-directed DNA polymerase, eukaryota [Tanacetum cinerariifolium]
MERNEKNGMQHLVHNYCEAVGNSGGILCVWEATVFKKDYATISDNFVSRKRLIWDYVSTLIDRWNGEVVVLGDFNEVRNIDERRGSCFNPTSARVFDQFISASGLVDVKMEGCTFTWSHPSGSKISKLDRFLVSEGIFSIFPSITAVCLDRHLSDHRPIILCEVQADFGPIPFRFYHSWISLEGFDAMVEQTWRLFSHNDANRMIRFRKKIQDLKVRIRAWIKDKRSSVSGEKDSIKKELSDIDRLLDELKINFQKSQVLGVGVPSSIVIQAASSIGCGVLHKKFRDTCFGYDNWLGDKPLKDLFPRLFALELNKEVTVADKVQGVVSSSFRCPVDLRFIWRWEFRVKEVRNFLDNLFLPSYADATKWVKYIPNKINVFVWRARRDFLPTRVNLSRRGILLESSSCPLCLTSEENIHHVLFGCGLAENIFRRICRWWELDWQALESFSDWNYWFSLIRLSSKVKALLEGVFCVAWWSIWGFRNRTIYNEMPPRRSVLFDDIVYESNIDKEDLDFIRTRLERNFKDSSEITSVSEFILPTPPRIMFQSSSALKIQ